LVVSASAKSAFTGAAPLRSLAAVVLDLDGVIYRGKALLPGARKTVRWLRRRNLKVFFLTNNSTLTRAEYGHRLAAMGIPCEKKMVFSSAYACGLYLRKVAKPEGPPWRCPSGHLANGGEGCLALVVGEGGLAGELEEAGIRVVRSLGRRKVDYVVVGMDRKITYKKLADAHLAISQGAKFIASNRDPVYPVENGVIPGGGTIVAAIQAASRKRPLVIGKPSPYILRILLERERLEPSQVLLVGDRLDTDVACGRRAGVWTAIVLTGVTSAEEVAKAPARLKPDWVLAAIKDLPELLGWKGRT